MDALPPDQRDALAGRTIEEMQRIAREEYGLTLPLSALIEAAMAAVGMGIAIEAQDEMALRALHQAAADQVWRFAEASMRSLQKITVEERLRHEPVEPPPLRPEVLVGREDGRLVDGDQWWVVERPDGTRTVATCELMLPGLRWTTMEDLAPLPMHSFVPIRRIAL